MRRLKHASFCSVPLLIAKPVCLSRLFALSITHDRKSVRRQNLPRRLFIEQDQREWVELEGFDMLEKRKKDCSRE